jgi:hypothetical protein
VLSLSLHLVALHLLQTVQNHWPEHVSVNRTSLKVVLLDREAPEDLEEADSSFEPKGQLVEIAPPEAEQKPDESEYLSQYDATVLQETRSERFDINPDVLSPVWSEEQELHDTPAEDVGQTDPATGARIGSDRFDPNRNGVFAAMPSPWKVTNLDGLDAPAPASSDSTQRSGAPQNDLLREKRGDATQLNTKEYLYAGYLQRIRRLVNFYWQQNIDNLPSSVRLVRPSYSTQVKAILNANGALEWIEVTAVSGSIELDDAVVRAFRVAGPYPHPPSGLIQPDGRVYLPDMSFTVQLGMAKARYQGIDPRAGVQFPGILKSPR